MPDSFFLDSNVCLYILDKHSNKFQIAKELLKKRPTISTQVISENINLYIGKLDQSKGFAIFHAKSLQFAWDVISITNQTIGNACSHFAKHNYTFFDCLILANAPEVRCNILYFEDMHQGHLIKNQFRIINTFSELTK
jgi:predicted nucleic acid-binding protein